jgi:phosphatidylserine decarboxylase
MVGVGERVGQGRRCGLRRLAREIELIVPAGWRVDVQLGQRVRSGQTLLATMLRKS